MCRRMMMTVTFAAALGTAGIGIVDAAQAWGGARRPVIGQGDHSHAYSRNYGRLRTAYRAYHGQLNHGRFYSHRHHL